MLGRMTSFSFSFKLLETMTLGCARVQDLMEAVAHALQTAVTDAKGMCRFYPVAVAWLK